MQQLSLANKRRVSEPGARALPDARTGDPVIQVCSSCHWLTRGGCLNQVLGHYLMLGQETQ